MEYKNSLDFANEMDQNDPLNQYRDQFIIPQHKGEDTVYFTGNSLGLQPKSAKAAIDQELEDWGKWGVEGHFHAQNPWFSYHELFQAPLKEIMGAKFDHEVVPMNTLTTNLHLLMVSFYRPQGRRYKILCEGKAFPSDQYALETQVKYHGYEPDKAILELYPREGEHLIREEDIKSMIDEHSSMINNESYCRFRCQRLRSQALGPQCLPSSSLSTLLSGYVLLCRIVQYHLAVISPVIIAIPPQRCLEYRNEDSNPIL